MTRREVVIATRDGECAASVHVPDGDGPWPGVLLYPDGAGVRETFREMGDQLARLGYVTLLPNVFYRVGRYRPFRMDTVFGDPDERVRLMTLVRGLTSDMMIRDAWAFLDFLADLPETSGSACGTTGYCLGGRASLLAAAHHPDRVSAAASFHGGNLASDDDPNSPHLHAGRIRASVYVAAARDDSSFPPEQFDRLQDAFTAAGVTNTVETYPAAHGFAVPDSPSYNRAADRRHWGALRDLYSSTLTT